MYIGFGSSVVVISQRIRDIAQSRHLRDNAILYRKQILTFTNYTHSPAQPGEPWGLFQMSVHNWK